MGVHAVNVSSRDLSALKDTIFKLDETFNLPFLSANIMDMDTGKHLFQPSITVDINKKKIGIIGITSPRQLAENGFNGKKPVITDPVKAAKKQIQKLKDSTDYIILLAHIQYRQIEKVVKELPEVNIVLGGDGYTTTWTDVFVGKTAVSYSGRQGQKLMLLKTDIEKNKRLFVQQQIVTLKKSFTEDGEIKKLVDETKRKLGNMVKKADFALEALKSRVNTNFVGFQSCRKCHSSEYSKWRSSKHYTAFNPLITAKKIDDHSCLPCHTTGYVEGGFVDVRVTPRMIHVQCESCHGPGAEHALNPTEVTTPVSNLPEMCVTCHDKKNSPGFDYQQYWQKIEH